MPRPPPFSKNQRFFQSSRKRTFFRGSELFFAEANFFRGSELFFAVGIQNPWIILIEEETIREIDLHYMTID